MLSTVGGILGDIEACLLSNEHLAGVAQIVIGLSARCALSTTSIKVINRRLRLKVQKRERICSLVGSKYSTTTEMTSKII